MTADLAIHLRTGRTILLTDVNEDQVEEFLALPAGQGALNVSSTDHEDGASLFTTIRGVDIAGLTVTRLADD